MPLKLTRVEYTKLKPREQESYNFQKLSAILADFGYRTIKLSDDWQGADFIAQHMENKTFLKVQLKSRLSFDKKYRDKDLYLAFPFETSWFLIPHDEFLDQVLGTGVVRNSASWRKRSRYSFSKLSKQMRSLLSRYKIA